MVPENPQPGVDRLKYYEFIVNSMADLIALVDRDLKYVAVNDSWCQFKGVERLSALGKTVPELLGEDYYRENLKRHIDRCFAGRAQFFQTWMELGKLGQRHCSVALYPFKATGETVTHMIAVTRDTTVENAAESQLIRAIQAAEEANRAKSAFLANMSHEIRTPMNAIIGMCHLLRQTPLSAKQGDYAAKIDTAAGNLLRIINDILDFSKVESGKVEIENEEFNLDEVLSHLASLTTLQAQQKQLDYKVHVTPDTPRNLLGDSLRLGQVLLNLVSNAIKFTDAGSISIFVKLVEADLRFVTLQFDVTDTGIGLEEKQLKRIFEPFSQADSTTTRRYGGTGLGLAISKRYIQMMGGTIEVQSKKGEGSTFRFTARFLQPTVNSRRAKALRTLAAGRRALLVGGEDNARRNMLDFLKRLTFAVTSVDTGQQAAEAIQHTREASEHSYDIVIVDGSHPGTDWEQAGGVVRKEIGRGPMAPALLLIALPYHASMTVKLAEAAGFDKVLVKPMTDSTMYDAIMNALARMPHRNIEEGAGGSQFRPAKPDLILQGAEILLVEDIEINREVAEEFLKIAGCKVTNAENGREALDILLYFKPKRTFDAVLMDIQMPVMDGYQAARAIRQERQFDQLPIIAMTADAVAGVEEACIAAGMNDYLTKPINSHKLYSTLARWIRMKAPSSGSERAVPASVLAQVALPPSQPAPAPTQLNVDRGVQRIGGNRALYLQLLNRFTTKYSKVDEQIDASLARGDNADVYFVLHSLKGVTANLSLDSLSKSAAEWEAALKAGKPAEELAGLRERFKNELSAAVEGITKALSAQ